VHLPRWLLGTKVQAESSLRKITSDQEVLFKHQIDYSYLQWLSFVASIIWSYYIMLTFFWRYCINLLSYRFRADQDRLWFFAFASGANIDFFLLHAHATSANIIQWRRMFGRMISEPRANNCFAIRTSKI